MSEVKEKYIAQVLIGLTACGGPFLAGLTMAWSSQLFVPLVFNQTYNFNVSSEEFSWMGAITNLGGVSSCMPTGFLCGKFGRKVTLIALTAPVLLGWSLLCGAVNPVMVIIGRYIQGLGCGGFCVVVPMYIGETAGKKIRGFLGASQQLMVATGILMSNILGGYAKLLVLNIMGVVFTGIIAVLFIFIPETPAFHVVKGKDEKAEKSIRMLRGKDFDPTEELTGLKDDFEQRKARQQGECKSLCNCFGLQSLFMGLGLMFFQHASGLIPIIFFTGSIFSASKISISSELCTVILGIVQTVMAFVSAAMVDKLGRKILLLISASFMALSTLLLGIYFYIMNQDESSVEKFTWVPLATLTLFLIMYNIGYGPVPWLMVGEIFDPSFRNLACGLCGTTNWALAFIVAKVYGPLTESIGSGPTFWIFSGLTVCGLFFVIFAVTETKGKTLEEIQESMRSRWKRKNKEAKE